jgi:hypothetical protein
MQGPVVESVVKSLEIWDEVRCVKSQRDRKLIQEFV